VSAVKGYFHSDPLIRSADFSPDSPFGPERRRVPALVSVARIQCAFCLIEKMKMKKMKGLLTSLPDDVLRTVNETYLIITKSFSPVALSVSLDKIVVS